MSRVQDHSRRERPIANDALTDTEREVLRLSDAGMDRDHIAHLTGSKPSHVAAIQTKYADSGRDAWKESARAGTMMLAAAIQRMRARQVDQAASA